MKKILMVVVLVVMTIGFTKAALDMPVVEYDGSTQKPVSCIVDDMALPMSDVTCQKIIKGRHHAEFVAPVTSRRGR